ncbi:hypothetical protein SAMN00120144_2783 [Hymenobacter roseosalivarius DSM 11622]|uniref:Uncharacterized protein n=1 Tax=Hymenobacter roseosalivarius DSM 11622 TaxID=645990 RepID=A0A1W1W2H3_9BACT|nr:hypothetical protein SAMN00120144_2783 [Hymenobacter roseosalivarius DSM 11622]
MDKSTDLSALPGFLRRRCLRRGGMTYTSHTKRMIMLQLRDNYPRLATFSLLLIDGTPIALLTIFLIFLSSFYETDLPTFPRNLPHRPGFG